ncbi:MAG: hypothetical protein M3R68_00600 [Acidobacteriota bacterium]|nr:hypothetical protein [Acidobacteriota bacterium]
MNRPSQQHRSLFAKKVLSAGCIFYLALGMFCAAGTVYGKFGRGSSERNESIEATNALAGYDWNLKQPGQPLLNLPDQFDTAIDFSLASPSLAYPPAGLRFPVFQYLEFDDHANKYILRLSGRSGQLGQSVEFKEAVGSGTYVSSNSSYVNLRDNNGVKTIRTSDSSEYTFIRFNDGGIRCIRIKSAEGSIITIVYSKDNLIHNIIDSAGRTIKFDYSGREIGSITQTWTANSGPVSRTWAVGSDHVQAKLAHASRTHTADIPTINVVAFARHLKPIPNNAVTPDYTAEMAGSDKQLAAIFGGPAAVAAANGFEPEELAEQYPLYRGDLTAFDGRLLRGHLSYAMHLYGNSEGTAESALYVPEGFTSHSSEPTPTDAAVTFFYPRLGNLRNVTLAVFHVANFALGLGPEGGTGVSPVTRAPEHGHAQKSERARIRIGSIGGPGGSCAIYKHSHIEFYRGDVGLPPSAAREHLRIDPATVFALNSTTATSTRRTTVLRSD